MENIRWCRVSGVGQKNIFAHTDDAEVVMISKNFTGMDEAQKGDIIQFVPAPFKRRPDTQPYFSVKWYALAPVIIARYFRVDKPVARPSKGTGTTACDWKAQREADADTNGLREVFARAADTGLGTARASQSE